jgi:hypothetical protein
VSGGNSELNLDVFEEKEDKNLDGWQGGSMSLARRKVLIDASLNSGMVYYVYV